MTLCFRPLIALLLLLLLAACKESQAPAPPLAPPAVSVVTLNAERVILTRQLPGRVVPFVIAEVRPQVTGIVRQRLFTEGSRVIAGQPLYQIDDAAYRAAYNGAQASLERAQAALEIALLNADRTQELIRTHAISQQEHDTALALQRQAEAELGVARAQVASAEVELGYARITSPIEGRVGKSMVTRGALVKADQDEPLTTVQQLDPIYVDLSQPASELLALRRELADTAMRDASGVPVTILLDDGSRYSHDGELAFADVAVDPMTGSYALRVIVPNPDHILMPGMYVRALVTNAILDRALLVPQQGLVRDSQGNASVMVVGVEGTVEQRAVEVNRAIGDRWLVKTGLVEGERVVVAGLQKIQPGMKAVASEAAAADRSAAPLTSGATGTSEPDADPVNESRQ